MLLVALGALARAPRPVLLRAGAKPVRAAGMLVTDALARTVGVCHCGACSVALVGEPTGASYCHCRVCRRLSGAPSMAIALAPVERVALAGATTALRTSARVSRIRCAACAAPLAALLGERTAALPLGLFDFAAGGAPPSWRPAHHMHYDSRVLDVADDLPKYAGSARGDLWRAGAAPRAPEPGADG
ncbi:hypothetical protein KFE25_003082 [Diacronema lutheri]|uniref:CENP-V/GFA domain-containing protein n=1 Tax=Diacronema lutheri TaxID=2081491 RepID=A0A8J5X8R4_DIALT|nr:hypothetical protein KFE25_003082 [Diacronema lutheri]